MDETGFPRPGWGAGPGTEEDMPSTHLSLHYHLIFSAKDRVAHMHKDWRGRLHAYMGGIVNDLGGIPETIGGAEDHVHLLVGLRATHCLADVLREIKASSSRWVHEELKKPLFSWQEGYGGRRQRFADRDGEKLHFQSRGASSQKDVSGRVSGIFDPKRCGI
jgi:REP element-mobilizing transposase RayT